MKREFEGKNCIFKNDCRRYNTEECCDPCWRQREFYFLLDNSNLPETQKDEIKLIPDKQDVNAFLYLDNIRENVIDFVKSGEGLYIHGPTGNGKTTWACKILKRYIMEKSIANGFEKRALFIRLPWYVRTIRQNISIKDEEFEQIRKELATIDLVVFDDVGAVAIKSDFVYDEVYSLISDRIDDGLCNIFTSNLTQEEISELLGERLISRMFLKTHLVHIQSTKDRRASISEFSVEKFMRTLEKDNK